MRSKVVTGVSEDDIKLHGCSCIVSNTLVKRKLNILEKKHISADQAIKQGLKNLYFNTALYRNQEKVLEIISRNK